MGRGTVNSNVMFSKQSDERSTPQALFDELNAEFSFDLDAAASCENAKCDEYFHRNALDEDWHIYSLSVFLNAPYSQCYEFIAKAAAEARKGCMVVCLLPSRTDTRWFHDYVWDRETHQPQPGVEVRFLKGRLKFGGAKVGAPLPSMTVVFRPPHA
jgi:phage N-6-adenine-methyltransferase